jgi:hypothetical protein
MSTPSIPVPQRFSDVDDRFVVVILEAPGFVDLQRKVTYTITMQLMIDSLRQGIETVASRSKSEAAQALFAQSLEDLDKACLLYSEKKWIEGEDVLRLAHNKFLLAGKKRPMWTESLKDVAA